MGSAGRGGAAAALAAIVAIVVLVGGSARAATGPSASYVVMYSDTGDYIGGGTQREFDSANAQITVSGSLAGVSVGVSGGGAGDWFTMEFDAAPGDVLASGGVYTNAERAPFREAGHPGIDIYGDGRGCNTDSGLFEVEDIGTDASGAVTRLRLVYEEHCEGGRAATWGEIEVGEPVSVTPLVAPSVVRWPASDVGAGTTVVPVTVKAIGGPVSIQGASVTGTNPGDFPIRADECSGQALAAGGSCSVWLRFVPTASGTRLATLHLAAAGGGFDVGLQGFAYGGTTSVTMTSDAGDYIGQAQAYNYTLAHGDRISMGGGRSYAGFGVNGANGDWWSADFVPANGDILVSGSTYANATRYPFNGTGPGLDVSGNGRGCNTLTGSFTVNSATFASDGTLRTASISFVQHCEGATPAFHGTFAYRAGDTTSPAPWMVPTAPIPAPPPPPPSTPTISSFSPTSGPPGTTVTIDGTNFSGTTGVTFGGASASYTVLSATEITATVPQNAATGSISVTTDVGTAASSSTFTVTAPPPPPAPVVSSFSPSSGPPGTTVTLTGSNFGGATDVAFAGSSAVYNVVSATQIRAVVPAGAASGTISVTGPGGEAQSSSPFTVSSTAPAISSFSPSSGPPGTTVTISGTNFNGATTVAFAGTGAVFNVVSATQITTAVPQGAASGQLSVTTGAGTATSPTSFTVSAPPAPPAPAISSFSPASGPGGTRVTISGTNLSGATTVAFAGTPAVFSVVSPTEITAAVPQGATTGKLAVTTAGGTAQSATDFTVAGSAPPPAVPTISSFSPISGTPGTTVTIDGGNLSGATAVAFAGISATFSVVSATQITAAVPQNATSGKLTVTTPAGTAQSTADFTVNAVAPVSPPPPTPTLPPSSGGGGGGGGGSSSIAVTITPASQTIASGATASWTISVTNTGGAYLYAVGVKAAATSGCGIPSASADTAALMPPGVTISYSCSLGGITGNLTNAIVASATTGPGDVITQSATAAVTVQTAAPFLPPALRASSPKSTSVPTGVAGVRISGVKVRMLRGKPMLTFAARVAKQTELTVSLFDKKGHKLAGWHKRAKQGTSVVWLAVPAKARHTGRATLRVAAPGNRSTESFRITIAV